MSRDYSDAGPTTQEYNSYASLAKTLTRTSICGDAAIPNHLSKLKKTLDSHPSFDLNERRDESEKPPLYFALMNSNYEAAALLIKRGTSCEALTPEELHQVHEKIGSNLKSIISKSSESLSQEESQALTKMRNAQFATMSVAMGPVLRAIKLLRDKQVTPSSPVSVASSISVSPLSPSRSGAGSPPRL